MACHYLHSLSGLVRGLSSEWGLLEQSLKKVNNRRKSPIKIVKSTVVRFCKNYGKRTTCLLARDTAGFMGKNNIIQEYGYEAREICVQTPPKK